MATQNAIKKQECFIHKRVQFNNSEHKFSGTSCYPHFIISRLHQLSNYLNTQVVFRQIELNPSEKSFPIQDKNFFPASHLPSFVWLERNPVLAKIFSFFASLFYILIIRVPQLKKSFAAKFDFFSPFSVFFCQKLWSGLAINFTLSYLRRHTERSLTTRAERTDIFTVVLDRV